MRIRATVAAVSGALALSALAVPAAQADDTAASYRAAVAKVRQAALAASDRAPAAEGKPYALNVSFSNFKIAKAVKVGTTNHISTTVTYTLTHGANVKITAADFVTDPVIYRGSATRPDNMLYGNTTNGTATSTVVSVTQVATVLGTTSARSPRAAP